MTDKDEKFNDVLKFWFTNHGPSDWFKKDSKFDAEIKTRFLGFYEAVKTMPAAELTETAETGLAAIITLDQFPRNMFRDTAKAFATDDKALALANMMIEKGFDAGLPKERRGFVYLPFMHSEEIEDQRKSVALYKAFDHGGSGYDYAVQHLELIEEFGRFPHRNAVLGRDSTPQEKDYLKRPDAGF